MDSQIYFFYKPETPIAPESVRGVLSQQNLKAVFSKDDRKIIDREWETLEGRCFSQPRGLGSLHDTNDITQLVYTGTNFKTYAAVSRTSERGGGLSNQLYGAMRVSSVGAAVRLRDGRILVHRRPKDADHVAGKLDASVAGLCHADEHGRLNFYNALLEKLSRELRIHSSEIKNAGVTGVHSATAPDFSGMVTYSLAVDLGLEEVHLRANQVYLNQVQAVPEEELLGYLVQHFCVEKDMIPDGCATLMSALPNDKFIEAVERLTKHEKNIFFGSLENGLLITRGYITY